MTVPTADEAQVAMYRLFAADPDAVQHYGLHTPEPQQTELICGFCYVIWPCRIAEAYSDGLRVAARDLLVHLDRAQAAGPPVTTKPKER